MRRFTIILLATGALCADTQQDEFRKLLKHMDILDVAKTAFTCGRFHGAEEVMRATGETSLLEVVQGIRKQFPGINSACVQIEAELKAAKVIE
jgi:hypothetical protein